VRGFAAPDFPATFPVRTLSAVCAFAGCCARFQSQRVKELIWTTSGSPPHWRVLVVMQHAAGVYAHPQHQQTAHMSGDFAGAGLPSMLLPPHQSPAAMPGPLHLPFKSASPPLGARPSHLSGGFAHSNVAPNMDENRYRYHVYERESTWAEVWPHGGTAFEARDTSVPINTHVCLCACDKQT